MPIQFWAMDDNKTIPMSSQACFRSSEVIQKGRANPQKVLSRVMRVGVDTEKGLFQVKGSRLCVVGQERVGLNSSHLEEP